VAVDITINMGGEGLAGCRVAVVAVVENRFGAHKYAGPVAVDIRRQYEG
jgi:hypothetical protein